MSDEAERTPAAPSSRRSRLVSLLVFGPAVAAIAVIAVWSLVAWDDGSASGPDDEVPAAAPTSTEPGDAVPAAPAASTIPQPRSTGGSVGRSFAETFDGDPTSPLPWNPADWDVTVHSRDAETFDRLEAMQAEHGPGCGPPTETHLITEYADAVFRCRSHLMTAIDAGGYGMIYLTPDRMVDMTEGEAVIAFDISTFRSSSRDWWDVWITPYEDQLQLPLDLGTDVDASGPPRRSVRVGLDPANALEAEVYEDFERVDVGGDRPGSLPSQWWVGYESFLQPDRARRDTVEIHLSTTHLRVGMPQYDFWWIDTDIPPLDWSQGVVQFGHHSYNPTKDCNLTNTPIPPVDECTPSTWHWDDVRIEPAVPFTVVRSDQRAVGSTPAPDGSAPDGSVPPSAAPDGAPSDGTATDGGAPAVTPPAVTPPDGTAVVPVEGAPTMTFDEPAPPGAMLRFAGIGEDVRISVDGGPWESAERQATGVETKEEHFASYWTPIPAGTRTVAFTARDWFGGPWVVRDATIWAPAP